MKKNLLMTDFFISTLIWMTLIGLAMPLQAQTASLSCDSSLAAPAIELNGQNSHIFQARNRVSAFCGTEYCSQNVSCPSGTSGCSAAERDCANNEPGHVVCDGVKSSCEPCPPIDPICNFDFDLVCNTIGLESGCSVLLPSGTSVNSCSFDWRYIPTQPPVYWSGQGTHAEVIMASTCSPTSINTLQVTVTCDSCPSAPATRFENLVCDPGGGGGY